MYGGEKKIAIRSISYYYFFSPPHTNLHCTPKERGEETRKNPFSRGRIPLGLYGIAHTEGSRGDTTTLLMRAIEEVEL